MSERLKILSIGAGAIGTYIGGSLALKGHQVIFVEREETAEQIHSEGLQLRLGESNHRISKPRISLSVDEAIKNQNFDVALFALKSFDTESFLNALPSIQPGFPPILCLSNGIDNEPTLAGHFGSENVIAGTVTSAIGLRGAGNIVLEKQRGVGIAGGHPLSKQLVDAFNEAGLNARLYPSAKAMKWSKMLTNLIANASSAILDLPPAEVFSNPTLYQLEISQLRETLAVMKAQNIKVVDLPGTPVRALAFAVQFLPTAISQPLIAKAVGGGRGGKMPSFHIDLHSGRGKSEVGYLNGAVVRAGERFNVPTPANRLFSDTLQGLIDKRLMVDDYRHKPGRLLDAFEG